MPFVQRNAQGEIVALLKQADAASNEFLPPNSPEVVTFLCTAAPDSEDQFSPLADLEMVRVIEDLVELLISKNVIVLTDLPPAVQKKLLRQQNRRAKFFKGVTIDDENNDLLF